MNKQNTEYHAGRTVAWGIYAISSLWLALAASWWAFSHVDYAYPLWYRWMAIDQHIARYAPEHPEKTGFAELSAEQHQRAFSEIVDAVHERGTALPDISYNAPGKAPQRLLDRAEVQHLEDVRRLFRVGTIATGAFLLLWLLSAPLLLRMGMPSWRARLAGAVLFVAALVVPLAVWGPKQVFYQLHVWLFPAENQWFFYWQESLMSTLMRAPVLFAGIAVEITLLALLLLPLFYSGGRSVCRRLLEDQ